MSIKACSERLLRPHLISSLPYYRAGCTFGAAATDTATGCVIALITEVMEWQHVKQNYVPHNSCGLINLSRSMSAIRRSVQYNRPLRTRLSSNDDGTSICSSRKGVSGVLPRKSHRFFFFVSESIRPVRIENGMYRCLSFLFMATYGKIRTL
ncbi:hypothetical protein G5I_10385 [Acromyrmex echinatior]|uniref:Uncharacterized protein n=1 Tax=Acromyrmex echinatior TaxID=103372 RepID=F4WWR5_ACREC|nr:hypothetical protein G5I_10385 [Acromyrmex echinatior]